MATRRRVPQVGDLLIKPNRNGIGDHYAIVYADGHLVEILKHNGIATPNERTVREFVTPDTRIEPAPPGTDPFRVHYRARMLFASARSRYSALGWNGVNCEHVARWVQNGTKKSTQANAGNFVLAIAGLGLLFSALKE